MAYMTGSWGAYGVSVPNLNERDHYKYIRADGKIILNWILKKLDRDLDWIVWAQDRIKGRALRTL